MVHQSINQSSHIQIAPCVERKSDPHEQICFSIFLTFATVDRDQFGWRQFRQCSQDYCQ